ADADAGDRPRTRRPGQFQRVDPAAAVGNAGDHSGWRQLQQVTAGTERDRRPAAADDRTAVDHRLRRRPGSADVNVSAGRRDANSNIARYYAEIRNRSGIPTVDRDAEPVPAD